MSAVDCNHVPQVTMLCDAPGDPTYPVVVCARCMTRWLGHVDDAASRHPPESKLPAPLRDAIILGQDEAALSIIENELGYYRPRPPNAIIGMSTPVLVDPGQMVQITSRPQTGPFRPTHFVVDEGCADTFQIDDLRVGLRSQFIQSQSLPARAFACEMRGKFDGEIIRGMTMPEIQARLSVVGELPPMCSSFEWDFCSIGQDLVAIATNISVEPARFVGYYLGHVARAG